MRNHALASVRRFHTTILIAPSNILRSNCALPGSQMAPRPNIWRAVRSSSVGTRMVSASTPSNSPLSSVKFSMFWRVVSTFATFSVSVPSFDWVVPDCAGL